MEFTYPAVRFKSKQDGKSLVLFGAPASDIDSWVGVPQKLKLGDDESSGFQRTVSPNRLKALKSFFSDTQNIMQNPLLCAIRKTEGLEVCFTIEKSHGLNEIGTVTISAENLSEAPLNLLFTKVLQYLEERSPELKTRTFPDEVFKKLREHYDLTQELREPEDDIFPIEEQLGSTLESTLEEALFESSQIAEFWDQIKAREALSAALESSCPKDDLEGFTREVLESYLRPIILVDGQHRLAGAVAAAKSFISDDPEKTKAIESLIIDSGVSADDAVTEALRSASAILPVSLLMEHSPAEHVFQFVVVNQKATPVPKALLGTIISTSLAPAELDSIKQRLESADIPLEISQAVSSLARNEKSPFSNKVARGFEQESGTKLPWTVLSTLADLFRKLEGAKYFHDTSMDHAAIWRNQNLKDSQIVAEWQARDYKSELEYWQDTNGPWQDVFISFWTYTRDKLANTEDEAAHNYWGNPRTSNIFNKPSLLTLATDFFSFLREQRARINSIDDIPDLVDRWLEYVSPKYFSRDWKLDGSGVKKDSVGIRRQWSNLWYRHRSTGSDISVSEYIKIKRD